MTWLHLTTPDGQSIWVNIACYCDMRREGDITRLRNERREVEVKELPDQIVWRAQQP